MVDPAHAPEFVALFAHADYVRQLARSLLADPSEADDVVQETWLAALGRRRRTPGQKEIRNPRAWLSRVVQNLVGETARRSVHRQKRERVSARPEHMADTTGAVENLEIHRRLVEAVAGLDEPYRTTIVLRFLEGHSPADLSKRLDVPVETVRTRAHRGLALLRQKLDRSYAGERSKWCTALAPLAGMDWSSAANLVSAPTALTGATVMGVKFKALFVMVALAVAAVSWSRITGIPKSVSPVSSALHEDQVAHAEPAESSIERSLITAVDRSLITAAGRMSSPASEPSTMAGDTAVALAGSALTGELVVVEANGDSTRDVNGWLQVGELGREVETRQRVKVTAGQWQMGTAPGELLKVLGVELEPPASLEQLPMLDGAESPLRLVAHRIPSVFLRVVDAGSGHDLNGVEVIRVDGWEAGAYFPSRTLPHESVAKGRASPLELPARAGRLDYWVRAREYAWRRVRIDHSTGGQHTVALVRQALLKVSADPADLPSPIEVRLYPGGHDDPLAPRMSAAPLERNGATMFSGLSPGEVQVRAEIGVFYDPPVVFAQQEVQLQAGETTAITLRLDTRLMGESPVPLAGSLRLPHGTDTAPVVLEVCRANGPPVRAEDHLRLSVGEMRRDDIDETCFHWDAGMVTPGRCKIIVHPFQVVQVAELPAFGDQHVVVEVESLATVVILVIDAATGEGLPVRSLGWSCFEPVSQLELDPEPGSEEERAIPMDQIPPMKKVGRFEFTAPVGPIVVGAGLSGYTENGLELDVKPGLNKFRLPLEQLPTLVLGFLDDGRVIGTASGFQVKAVNRDIEWRGWWRHGSRYVGTVDEPGLYEIGGTVEGYLPFAPRQVYLDRGKRIVVDIPLFREQ